MRQETFVEEQFALSTAEEESAQSVEFWGEQVQDKSAQPVLQAGKYRVIAGQLFRLVQGVPSI